MATIVEQRLAGDPGQVAELIAALVTFFRTPANSAALRLAVLGIVPVQNHKREWAETTAAFRTLLGKALTVTQPGSPLAPAIKIHEHTLQRFATGTHAPSDARIPACLALLVIHQLKCNPALREQPLIQEAYDVNSALSRVESFVATRRHFHLALRSGGHDLRELLRSIHRALGAHSDASIVARLFGGEQAQVSHQRDISYYVVYRYSTSRNEVVKSFLAILGPRVNNLDCYSFTHVYRRGVDQPKRLSRGAVLGFQNSITLIAGVGMAPDDGSGEAPISAGLKALAIPHSAFAPDHKRLSGVLLSNSLAWQPLVARCAMLHLGFRSDVGEVTDAAVDVKFLPAAELDADIEKTCARFQLNDRPPAEPYLQFIKKCINNQPAVDRGDDGGLFRALVVEDGREPSQ